MKTISWISLSIYFVLFAAAGFGYSYWAVGNGFSAPVSGVSVSISLFLAAAILLALAFPIYRYKRALKKILEAKSGSTIPRPTPVDPFYAVKVLILAKAAAITASLFIGWHAGVIAFILTTPVIASEVIRPNIAALATSVILLVVCFVVQNICKLPSDPGPKTDMAAA